MGGIQARTLKRNYSGTLLAASLTDSCLDSFLTLPRTVCLANGATHNGLGSTTSINNQDNYP